MRFLRNSVKTRLWCIAAVFSIGIVVLLSQGLFALRSIGNAANNMGDGKDIVADILPPPLYLIETQLVVYEMLDAPASERKATVERFAQLKKDYNDRNDYWKGKSSTVEPMVVSPLFGKQKQQADEYWQVLEKDFIPAALEGRDSDARQAFKVLKKLYTGHRDGVDATVKAANDWANARLAQLSSTTETSNKIFIIAAVISLILGIVVAKMTLKSVTVPLSVLERTIREVETTSDFTKSVPVQNDDELGKTASSFNKLLTTVRSALSEINQDTQKISVASEQLAQSSVGLANSSQEQSSAATSISATVEEVTVSISHLSSNASDAAAAARHSGDLSGKGAETIRSAVVEINKIADTVNAISSAIEDLETQSQKISSVVQVIRDVADQTNLLALNAAIEAARAGEQGRGFAVVADEVRKLAERTAKATEEIAQTIRAVQQTSETAITSVSAAVAQASEGVKLSQEAGEAIERIESSAKQVVELVAEMTSALSEQSVASGDIARQVEKVAHMACTNNDVSGDFSREAEQLEQLARNMRCAVGRFKI